MDTYLKYLILIAAATVSIFLLSKSGKQPPADISEDPESTFLEFLPQMEI